MLNTRLFSVVKVTVLLSDIQDYAAMNEVYILCNAGGIITILGSIQNLFFLKDFNNKPPARIAYMATLPLEAKVEIEAVAIVGNIVDVEERKNGGVSITVTLPTILLVSFINCMKIYQW